MEQTFNYEEALKKLDEIVQKMEQNEYGIDELTAQLKTAMALIARCKDKLTKTDDEIKQILANEDSPLPA